MTDRTCPFCGSAPYFNDGEFSDGRQQVWCSEDRPACPIGGIAMTPEQWNRRTPPLSSPEQIRPRLVEILDHYFDSGDVSRDELERAIAALFLDEGK